MNDDDPIRAYVAQFARRLSGYGFAGRRVLEEIECHLRELADALYRRGLEPTAAAREAIERFGSAEEVLREFQRQAPIESEVNAMLRYVLTPLAAATMLVAALFVLFSFFDDAPLAASAIKIAVGAVVASYGTLLLYQLWLRQPASRAGQWLGFGGALLMIAIGSAGAVWAVHLGIVTGDWEYYGLVGNGLLVVQGMLAALHYQMFEPPTRSTAA